MNKDDIQLEAKKAIGNKTRAGIASSMGTGKTLIGINHMASEYNDNSRFLIVGSKKAVYKTWCTDIEKFKLDELKPHISFTTYLSLNKKDLDYDVVYLDECHNLKFSHEDWLIKFKGKIIGLTGTPPKSIASERGQMVNKYCPIVFTYKTDDAVNDGILNDYRIVVHYINLDQAKNIRMKSKTSEWYTSEQASYDYWSSQIIYASPSRVHMTRLMRMKTMQGFLSKELYAEKIFNTISEKCLLFANTKDQADRLCNFSYHSTNPRSEDNLKKFINNEILKLTAVQQLNESVNIPNLKQGIIMHAYGNERVASQKIGRMLRLNPSDTATIHILCYKNTVDEEWVSSALSNFDQTKIKYI